MEFENPKDPSLLTTHPILKWILFAILIFLFILIIFIAYVFSRINNLEQDKSVNQNVSIKSFIKSLPRVDRSIVETTDDPWKGDKDAPIVIVEFSDFQCPFCKQSVPILKELLSISPYPIKFIYRDFPVFELHPFAFLAAQAGECAQDQGKFWQLHDLIFENQDKLTSIKLKQLALQAGLDVKKFSTCLSSNKYKDEVMEDMQTAIKVGVSGTPTWFINGYRVPGVLNINLVGQLIDEIMLNKNKNTGL